MKTILLLGDSIRLSYQATVRARLDGKAYVNWPDDNCMHTTNLLLRLNEYAILPQPDIIHLNAGLWDLTRVRPDVEDTIVSLTAYAENVRTILRLLQQFTSAQLIWATCTPIDEEAMLRTHLRTARGGRVNRDIEAANVFARGACAEYGAAVNDLYGAVQNNGIAISDDGVHFPPPSAEQLGNLVADFITPYI